MMQKHPKQDVSNGKKKELANFVPKSFRQNCNLCCLPPCSQHSGLVDIIHMLLADEFSIAFVQEKKIHQVGSTDRYDSLELQFRFLYRRLLGRIHSWTDSAKIRPFSSLPTAPKLPFILLNQFFVEINLIHTIIV